MARNSSAGSRQPLGPSFTDRVFEIIREIPPGRVTTYGTVAAMLGDPRKAREVGWALHVCPDDVPAHRVVNRLGEVSGDAHRTAADSRRARLEREGVTFDANGRIELDRFGWHALDDG